MSGRVAAFFDLDGTLMPWPSLERRFFRALRYRREIPVKNYSQWMREALKLLPRGINQVMHANKMYLKGLQVSNESCAQNQIDSPAHKSGHTEEGQASVHFPGRARSIPRWPVPRFFEDAVERLAWHAMQGHTIVIVSGTLEPLAGAAARALETELGDGGIVAGIIVRATNLEESEGRWTGRILGEAMFGKAKARAVVALVEEMNLDLSQSWAYGDSAQDRWMLAAVGHPVAVNTARSLARIARTQHWPVFHWQEERDLTERGGERRNKREDLREERTTGSLPQSQEVQKQLQHPEGCI